VSLRLDKGQYRLKPSEELRCEKSGDQQIVNCSLKIRKSSLYSTPKGYVKVIASPNHDIHPSFHHTCTFVISQKITTYDLAHTVSLASLTLQTVFLIFVVMVAMSRLSTVADMVHSVLTALLNLLSIHII